MSASVSSAIPATSSVRKPLGARAIAAITIGSGLEFYDFSVYSFLPRSLVGSFSRWKAR